MKVARYVGGGQISIVQEDAPALPEGGLVVRTEACGLCSGELMDWYMDRKIPHVLGHEVAGIVSESDVPEYPVGTRIFPHHHAPCLNCDECGVGNYVHCAQWKRSKLLPGGMAEAFAVGRENLNDTLAVGEMRPVDAALIEPLACAVKSIRLGRLAWDVARNSKPGPVVPEFTDPPTEAVIGLGVMGLMHMLLAGKRATGYDLNPARVAWATDLGMNARLPETSELADIVYVCPGNKPALDFALSIAKPGAAVVLFAPMPPGEQTPVDLNAVYFKDIKLVSSYSCGPDDTAAAARAIEAGQVRAEQVVSHFIGIDELPQAYQAMKAGEILKPMVIFE
jgi:L-iditol 2-dehydrogenase